MDKETISKRLELLRNEMTRCGVQATIIPQTDPHQSEYISDHWQVRRHFSGFTGSAGSLVVTFGHAYIWADSRYWLQAKSQLEGTSIGVMEEGKPETPSIEDWLCSTLKQGDTVGIDGFLFSVNSFAGLQSVLALHGINIDDAFDPADRLWTDRPALPSDPIFIHGAEFEGETPSDRIAMILGKAADNGSDAVLLSDLAEIAWTLCIRSNDVKYNPVTTSYLYLSPTGNILFVDGRKVTPEVNSHLAEANVTVQPYGSLLQFIAAIPEDTRIMTDEATTSIRVRKALGGRLCAAPSAVALPKGCKNAVQVACVRRAMEYDGRALVRSFMEIENRMSQNAPLTEMDVAEILDRHRSAEPGYMQPSFGTIAGYGPHGAIVHYEANEQTNATLHPDNLLLVDSGGNYAEGTTDITRTITLGNPTAQQKHDFTLVMKGHIALATAIFPEGTDGHQLDALARINLWREGLGYLHGTGHGVGFFLNCHEGPQRIHIVRMGVALKPGMITSDEPGLYREGLWGIRCENLLLTTEAMTTEFGRFYGFETLTLFPFDLRLFATELMTPQEIAWVNNYHDTVKARLLPLLNNEEAAWLESKCKHL